MKTRTVDNMLRDARQNCSLEQLRRYASEILPSHACGKCWRCVCRRILREMQGHTLVVNEPTLDAETIEQVERMLGIGPIAADTFTIPSCEHGVSCAFTCADCHETKITEPTRGEYKIACTCGAEFPRTYTSKIGAEYDAEEHVETFFAHGH